MSYRKLTAEEISNMRPEDFRDKNLSGSDFSNRYFVGADFSNSICKDCDFSNCDLSQANFSNADLYRCKFNKSILYATVFSGANLTRADLTNAYIYGILIHGFCNVTYSKLLDFRIEKNRRKSTIVEDKPENIKIIPFASKLDNTDNLCLSSYQVDNYRFSFINLEPQEEAMQRSQIYNRLKRTYKENEYGEESLHCWYLERYYLTRSFYKYNPLTGATYKEFLFQSLLKTVLSFLNEKISGFGLKPKVIIRNLFILLVIFITSSICISVYSENSGVIYKKPILSKSNDIENPIKFEYINLGRRKNVSEFIIYGLVATSSFEFEHFIPYGLMIPLTFLYTFLCLILVALLFSSFFLRILSD